jgi:flagellar basal body-associated protein FliL
MDQNIPKKHSFLKIAGIVILILVVIVGVIIFFAFSATSAPTKVARDFIQDMSANQPDQAYTLTSQAFHQQNSLTVLNNLLTKYPDITNISDITLNSRTVKNNTAEITGTVTTSKGTYPVDVKLINESGWKVYSFNIKFGTN